MSLIRNKLSERYKNETQEQLIHRREINHKSYLKHKEKYALNANTDKENQNKLKIEFIRRNPEKYLWDLAFKRAQKKGLDFNIDVDDIVIPEYCPVLGIKLGQVKQKRKHMSNSPSIDRIDNTKGYIKGNIAVVSYKANVIKKDLSIEQIENLYNYSLKVKNQYEVTKEV